MKKPVKKRARPYLPVLLGALLALAFVVVKVHAVSAADAAAVKFLAEHRTPFWTAFFEALTNVGSTLGVGIALCVAAVALFFMHKREKSYAIGLVVSVAGAKTCEVALKLLIERARPDAYALFHLDSYSFPSGHATAAMALYGFLAYALCKIYPGYKTAWVALAALAVAGISISRVYLGVHYPSDVVGGMLLGAIWVIIGINAAKYWRT